MGCAGAWKFRISTLFMVGRIQGSRGPLRKSLAGSAHPGSVDVKETRKGLRVMIRVRSYLSAPEAISLQAIGQFSPPP